MPPENVRKSEICSICYKIANKIEKKKKKSVEFG